MTVIFLIMMLTHRLMKLPWYSLLISVFPISDQGSNRSFHRDRIKYNRRRKSKCSEARFARRDKPAYGVRGYVPPENFEILVGQRSCDFMHFGGKRITENELFIIIKLDVASSAVSPF